MFDLYDFLSLVMKNNILNIWKNSVVCPVFCERRSLVTEKQSGRRKNEGSSTSGKPVTHRHFPPLPYALYPLHDVQSSMLYKRFCKALFEYSIIFDGTKRIEDEKQRVNEKADRNDVHTPHARQ